MICWGKDVTIRGTVMNKKSLWITMLGLGLQVAIAYADDVSQPMENKILAAMEKQSNKATP